MADLENIDNTAPADSLYEGSVKINLIRARVDGLYTVLSDITAAEANQVENLGTTAITAAQWVYLSELDQSLTTTSTVTFGTINAFTLGGKLTAGAVEIEGSAFDINGGTIDGVSLTDITMSLGSDADGDIYYRSSNKLVRLAKGTEDYVLTMGAAVPEWAAAGAGAGDITGPDTSTDHAIPRWHETGGDELLDSGITISDANVLAIGAGTLDVSGGTLTLAANQISGDKVEGGTIAAITITTLTIGTSLILEGGTYDTTLQPGTPTESITYTWPLADGSDGQVLKTDGSGALDWVSGAAGADTALSNLASIAINTSLISDTTNTDDLGSSGITWKDLYISGTAYLRHLTMASSSIITFGATVDVVLPDNYSATLEIKDSTETYLTVHTATTDKKIILGKKLEAGSVEIEGSNFDINGGNIDNTVVGNGNPSTGSFTTLSLCSVGELRFFDNGNYVGFEAPALDANQIWVLPSADGAANTVLKTDGSGTLGWVSAPGADTALSNLASVAINESLISDTDDNDDLGSDAKQWKDLYINGTANIDSLVADTADINAGTIDGAAIGASTAITDLDLNCDLEFEAAKDILIIDNSAVALEIKEGANAYVTFVTTDDGEKITFNKTIDAIGAATISTTQWGYLGACVAGGGQLLAALTAGESTQLEAIGATTISDVQWGYLGACGAGGGQLLAALTTGESTQLEAIGATTISLAQWGYLGAMTAPYVEINLPAGSWSYPTANPAPLDRDIGTNGGMFRHLFDDTTEEFILLEPAFEIPDNLDTAGTVYFSLFGYAAVADGNEVQFKISHSSKDEGESWDAAYGTLDSGDKATDADQDQIDQIEWNETVSNLGWAAQDLIRLMVSRIAIDDGTKTDGDYGFLNLKIRIPVT